MSLEFVTTSGRRSSDPSTALVYWGSSSSSTSLLITTSRASTYVDDRKHMRTTRIVVVPGRPHSLLSIRAKHQTTATARLYQQLIQRLRDTSQEQDRVIQYNYTLPPHRARLSFTTYFFARWMAIIEQKNTVFDITTTSTTGAKESSSRPKTGTSLYRISSMKSRARTMHCKETAQTRIKGSSVMRWIGAIGSILVHCLNFIVSAAWSRCVVGERFSPPEGFVRSIHIA